MQISSKFYLVTPSLKHLISRLSANSLNLDHPRESCDFSIIPKMVKRFCSPLQKLPIQMSAFDKTLRAKNRLFQPTFINLFTVYTILKPDEVTNDGLLIFVSQISVNKPRPSFRWLLELYLEFPVSNYAFLNSKTSNFRL